MPRGPLVAESRLTRQQMRHCVALRRMLTAQRVSRLLVRWRCAALDMAHVAALGSVAAGRAAAEAAIRAESERVAHSMAWADRHRKLAAVATRGAGRVVARALARWREGAAAAAEAEAAALREQETAALVRQAATLRAELGAARLAIQKPTQLERALAEATRAKEALQACTASLPRPPPHAPSHLRPQPALR